MKLTKSLLALALASLFVAPAFGQEQDEDEGSGATVTGSTQISNDVDVVGFVEVAGYIQIDAEAGATVTQEQVSTGNFVGGGSYLGAAVGDQALFGASGNIGVNVSSGVSNVQANDAAIASLTMNDNDDLDGLVLDDEGNLVGVRRGALASAMVFNSQDSNGNYATTDGEDEEGDTGFLAALNGDALGAVSGNVGVNIAAGTGNAQGNAMAVTVADGAAMAKATSVSEQFAYNNAVSGDDMDLDLVASFGGGALAGASGNLHVNIASGVGNVQHNGLAIAASTALTGGGGGQ